VVGRLDVLKIAEGRLTETESEAWITKEPRRRVAVRFNHESTNSDFKILLQILVHRPTRPSLWLNKNEKKEIQGKGPSGTKF
jgi:hypothetical protein